MLREEAKVKFFLDLAIKSALERKACRGRVCLEEQELENITWVLDSIWCADNYLAIILFYESGWSIISESSDKQQKSNINKLKEKKWDSIFKPFKRLLMWQSANKNEWWTNNIAL